MLTIHSRRALVGIAMLATLAVCLDAQSLPQRPNLLPGQSNAVSKIGHDSGLVVQDLSTGITPLQLAQSILSGPGVTISNVVYNGVPGSAGTFTATDPTIVGFSSGIILSSGAVASVVGPNVSDGTSTVTGLGGDADLQAIIPGYTINGACRLEFDFTTAALAPGQTGAVNFNFTFTSEEYNEYVNTSFNDVFGFFLNGQNIALLQNLTTTVQIDTVNGGNPYGPPPNGVNWNQFRNNDLSDGGGAIDTEMDGLTVVLTAFGNITGPGPHHIKLAIADAGDTVLDSNVFIQGASLVTSAAPTCIAPTPTSPVNATAQLPVSWQVRAVANNGSTGASVTVAPSTVTFDAGFAGNPVVTTSPVAYSPNLPISGQPATTTVTWTPPLSAIGQWSFRYLLTDNQGTTAFCTVFVNVIPSVVSGPTCVAPTPTAEVESVIFGSVDFDVAAITQSGLGGGTVTIQSVEVEFDAQFAGGSVTVPSPGSHAPALPVSGQPATTHFSWNPQLEHIGQWEFTYHLVDSFGQTADCTIQVNVRDAALVLGVAPTIVQIGTSPLDLLRVDPVITFPIGVDDQPNVYIPNEPVLFGLEIYAQVVLINPVLFPSDLVKTSPTLKYRIGLANFVFASGSGLDLIATDIADIGEDLPYEFSIPGL